uniref:Uncharacterized protein n=1 Tax=Thermosporothrix sp. COM3 TaxID=2490863 RepID=A0A455SIQ4_9CHLR|nr:hypothetical protein KTC_15800 [Thermosporothrix sp. COM3]
MDVWLSFVAWFTVLLVVLWCGFDLCREGGHAAHLALPLPLQLLNRSRRSTIRAGPLAIPPQI